MSHDNTRLYKPCVIIRNTDRIILRLLIDLKVATLACGEQWHRQNDNWGGGGEYSYMCVLLN